MSIAQKMLNMVQIFGIALEDSSSGEAVSLKSINGAASVTPVSSSPDYEVIAASQTAQVIGTTGAAGDYIETLSFNVTATSAGKVTLYDNGVEIWSNAGTIGIGSWAFPLRVHSQNGAFTITTQASVTALVTGDFT